MSRRRARRSQPTTDQRSPDERLEALVREPNRDRARRMLSRIHGDLDARPEPDQWLVAARSLSDRLIISFDTLYYFAEVFTDCLLSNVSGSDPKLVQLESEMEAVERAHGLREDEAWRIGHAPDEWLALNDAWERRARAIVATALRACGQSDLADEHEQRPQEFEKRSEKGRVDLWGEEEGES